MKTPRPKPLLRFACAASLAIGLAACDGEGLAPESQPSADQAGSSGKDDSGWVGADTYEVGAVVMATVRREATGEWADLLEDADLQTKLIDSQLKFIKTTAERHGWRFNQLADSIEILDARQTDAGDVELEYWAVVDMLGRYRNDLPELEDIDPGSFRAQVPADPIGVGWSTMEACSQTDGSHGVSSMNFHYYFAPEREGCELELTEADVEITEVFPRLVTYPEYDKLLQALDEDGEVFGFRAALVPNRGDDDPSSRFNAHAQMLEEELGLTGEDIEDGTLRRYRWVEDGVGIIIDLYDPTKVSWDVGFASAFRQRLAEYTLVHYNGHSSYGTKHLLDEPDSFSDSYQIIMMHSCQSYAYYTRQVFRAKATEEDPSGFALADVVATGKSSYPSGSPPTLRVVLSSLFEGISAVARAEPSAAPDWLSIAEEMSDSTWGDIMYGVAGVRDNLWQPGQ